MHKLSTALRWAPFAVVAVELVLLLAGIIDLGEAALAIVVLEVALAAILVGEAVTLYSTYDRARGRGESRTASASAALDAALPPVVARLVKQELVMLSAFAGAFGRRTPRAPEGAQVVPSASNLRTLMKVLVAVSLLELVVVGVVVEMLVSSAVVRWALVVLSAYGLVWVVGFTSSLRRSPHIVGADLLRLRFAMLADVRVPTRLIASVRRDRCGGHKRLLDVGGDTLSLSVMGVTNVLVELSEPHEIDLGRKGMHTVTSLRFHADDPDGAARTIREGAEVADRCLTVPVS